MGGMFGGAPKAEPADTSLIEKQQAQAEEDKAKLQREEDAKKRLMAGRRGRSLLQFGTDQGVLADTLG